MKINKTKQADMKMPAKLINPNRRPMDPLACFGNAESPRERSPLEMMTCQHDQVVDGLMTEVGHLKVQLRHLRRELENKEAEHCKYRDYNHDEIQKLNRQIDLLIDAANGCPAPYRTDDPIAPAVNKICDLHKAWVQLLAQQHAIKSAGKSK